jgi:DNA modification methylase
MSDQLSLLNFDPLTVLPTTKVKKADRVGVHGWTNFYAAFPDAFVSAAITALNIKPTQTLFDPFVGSGTTLVAALKMGVSAIGVDLDPFSCLLSRCKVATRVDSQLVNKILAPAKRNSVAAFSADAKSLFDSDCLVYASNVFMRIRKRFPDAGAQAFSLMLKDREGVYDSEVVALTALCLGASDSANLIRGSNPTWYRKALEGEKDNLEALYSSTQSAAQQMVGDLQQLGKDDRSRKVVIVNKDLRNLGAEIKRNSVDFIITSPPYLTRLDYVIKHLPNLLILSGFIEIDVDSLRGQMIGTTKMIEKGEPDIKWGSECLRILAEIRDHPSYASSRYYVWHYYQYFKSLYFSFEKMLTKLKKNGKGIMVLQDSLYKDVEIRLDVIVAEMLESLGVQVKSIRRDQVKINMKQLNPAHQKISANKKPSEHCIFFEKLT